MTSRRLMRTFLLSLCLCLALAACGCSESSGTGTPRLGETNERARLDLIEEYRRRLRERPEDAEDPAFWFRWGVLLMELGIPDSARHTFQKAVNLAPQDRRARQFLGHALYAQGLFGQAYERYREVDASGVSMEDVLERTRERIGERRAPGLAGVIDLVVPEQRRRFVDLAAAAERLGERGKVSLLAVDRVLLGWIVHSETLSSEIPGRLLLEYFAETERAAQYDERDHSNRVVKEPEKLVAELTRVAGGALDGLRIDRQDGDAAAAGDGPRLSLRLEDRVFRGVPGGGELLDLLNEAMESAGSPRRYFPIALPQERRLWVVCVTTRQFDFVKDNLFDSDAGVR